MWISWLLKYDGYPPGVVVALLLHGLLLYIFLPKDFDPANQVRIEPASYVVASAVTQSPQRRRTQQLNTQRQNEEAERQRAAERRRQQEAEQQRQAEAQRQRQAEAERQRQAEAQRQRQAEADRQREQEQERQRQAELERQRQAQERERQAAAQREAEAAAASQAAANAAAQSVEDQLISQYVALIRDLISSFWNRSPDTRNGMLAIVKMRLTPTGEIISRDIVQSSGNANFDRSVLQAVDRVGSFPELKDMPTPIFERNFRELTLEFTPEDLLR